MNVAPSAEKPNPHILLDFVMTTHTYPEVAAVAQHIGRVGSAAVYIEMVGKSPEERAQEKTALNTWKPPVEPESTSKHFHYAVRNRLYDMPRRPQLDSYDIDGGTEAFAHYLEAAGKKAHAVWYARRDTAMPNAAREALVRGYLSAFKESDQERDLASADQLDAKIRADLGDVASDTVVSIVGGAAHELLPKLMDQKGYRTNVTYTTSKDQPELQMLRILRANELAPLPKELVDREYLTLLLDAYHITLPANKSVWEASPGDHQIAQYGTQRLVQALSYGTVKQTLQTVKRIAQDPGLSYEDAQARLRSVLKQAQKTGLLSLSSVLVPAAARATLQHLARV